jgi:hypothetical protein
MPCIRYKVPGQNGADMVDEYHAEMGYEPWDWDPVRYQEEKRRIFPEHYVFMCGEDLDPDELPLCSTPGCEYLADFLCDEPMGDGKTCDLPLCKEHATEVGEEVHLCPIHKTRQPVPVATHTGLKLL